METVNSINLATRVAIDDDIEMVEEDSDVEEEVVPDIELSAPTMSTSFVTVSEKDNVVPKVGESEKSLSKSASPVTISKEIVDITPARRTPISNNITQFLSPMNMSKKDVVGIREMEKKNCKVKRVTIDDDIEMLEEDSDAEEVSLSHVGESASKPTPAALNEKVDVVDISADDNEEDIPLTDNCDVNDVPVNMARKMQAIKRTEIDDDICMLEVASDVEEFDAPQPYNTAETPIELQLSNSTASQNNENSRIITHDNHAINDAGSIEKNVDQISKIQTDVSKSPLNAETLKVKPANDICTPRLRIEIQQEQQLFSQKNSQNKSQNSGSSRSKKSRADDLLMRQESETPVNDYERNEADNVERWNDFFHASSPPSRLNSVNPAVVLSGRTPSPPDRVYSNSPVDTSMSAVRFYHPSGLFLSQCCEKLEFVYSHNAYAFWAQIYAHFIKPNSIPENTYTVVNQRMSGFASMSLFFTGSEDNASEIKDKFVKYFLQNSLAIGDAIGEDLSQSFNPKVIETTSANDLLAIHFVALSRWFECRFAIFDDGHWKRYGNWNIYDLKNYIPIVMMEKKNGKYSPIFTFKN
uniref:Uncharacterized protein n=1 Tax=Panagrolaimus sp. ES5 TaxID=591445 RepID=A0AC34F4E1_9BILA